MIGLVFVTVEYRENPIVLFRLLEGVDREIDDLPRFGSVIRMHNADVSARYVVLTANIIQIQGFGLFPLADNQNAIIGRSLSAFPGQILALRDRL